MLRKKFYIPIGILFVVICAVGFFSLRSDVPDEPIVIYKTTTPLRARVNPLPPDVEDTPEKVPVPSTAAMSFETSTVDTSMPDLDGLSSHEKRHLLEERLAEAQRTIEERQGVIEERQGIIEELQAELEVLRASKRDTDSKRATLKVLTTYKKWLDAYNAEGDELSDFAASYNQNPSPTAEEEKEAKYVRKRLAERPMEFLVTTNELPLPYREQYILKYHANLVRDIGLEEANKIFTIR